MIFKKQKKDFLNKKDKSKKGVIDKKIKKLIKKINSLDNYYTTSSCSGRILLLATSKSSRKDEAEWLFLSHKKVNFNQIKKSLKNLSKQNIWFKLESAILHVTAKTIEDAVKLLNLAKNIGFKRGGIIGVRKNKISLELISTERIETIIAKNSKIIVSDDYLNYLIEEANLKLEKSWKKIDRLYNKLGILEN